MARARRERVGRRLLLLQWQAGRLLLQRICKRLVSLGDGRRPVQYGWIYKPVRDKAERWALASATILQARPLLLQRICKADSLLLQRICKPHSASGLPAIALAKAGPPFFGRRASGQL
jgi:hypothetical protein